MADHNQSYRNRGSPRSRIPAIPRGQFWWQPFHRLTQDFHGALEGRPLLPVGQYPRERVLRTKFLRVPRILIEAPANVQTVVTDDPATRTLRVHLLCYNAPPQTTPAKDRPYVLPVPIEDAPMYRATLALSDKLKSARAFNRTTELKKSGNKVTLRVEDIHEVVTLKY